MTTVFVLFYYARQIDATAILAITWHSFFNRVLNLYPLEVAILVFLQIINNDFMRALGSLKFYLLLYLRTFAIHECDGFLALLKIKHLKKCLFVVRDIDYSTWIDLISL